MYPILLLDIPQGCGFLLCIDAIQHVPKMQSWIRLWKVCEIVKYMNRIVGE